MRLLHSSDWHVDVVTAGFRRFDDVTAAVNESIRAAIDMKADYYLFTGDFCDPNNDGSSHLYSRFLLESAIELADAGVKSIWMAGNHDVVESGEGVTTLSSLRALSTSAHYAHMVHLVETPQALSLLKGTQYKPETDDVAIICLPFTSHDRDYDPAERVKFLGKTLREKFVIIASHLNVEGIEIGSETTDFPRGRNVFFPKDACNELEESGKTVLRLQGHYHKQQVFEGIYVVGSLVNLTFGEQDNKPCFQVIDV